MADDLLKRLSRIGERVSIPCPDNIRGCLVFHYRVDTDPACVEAINEIARLREALEKIIHEDLWTTKHPDGVTQRGESVFDGYFGGIARAALEGKDKKL